MAAGMGVVLLLRYRSALARALLRCGWTGVGCALCYCISTICFLQAISLAGAASTLMIYSVSPLVAGVAHEVNTPLGIAVTASSVVSEALDSIRDHFQTDSLTREAFAALMREAHEGQLIVVGNLSRAAKLVRDFKQAAANQADETLCEYDIAQTTRALIASLHPETKKIPVVPRFDGPVTLMGTGYPGVLMQVLTNLIMNSVRHAFEGVAKPLIAIELREAHGQVELIYRDNGMGVPAALHNRIFEPLFTTRRGRGGTGLGLNIVYTLVTKTLGGTIDVSNLPDSGACFRIRMPLVAPVIAPDSAAG